MGQGVTHEPTTALASVYNEYPIVHIYRTANNYDMYSFEVPYLKFLLVHELAHIFGMHDVYNSYAGHNPQGVATICFMSKFNVNSYTNFLDAVEVDTSLAFCEQCYSDIEEKVNSKMLDRVYEGDE